MQATPYTKMLKYYSKGVTFHFLKSVNKKLLKRILQKFEIVYILQIGLILHSLKILPIKCQYWLNIWLYKYLQCNTTITEISSAYWKNLQWRSIIEKFFLWVRQCRVKYFFLPILNLLWQNVHHTTGTIFLANIANITRI